MQNCRGMQDNPRPMTGDQGRNADPASEGGGERDRLYDEIKNLREPGLHDDILDELPLPQLTRMARAICPDAKNDVKAMRQAACRAAERVKDNKYNYSEAIPVMWGATPDTKGKDHDDRRKEVLGILHASLKTYDRYRRKPMADLLEAELRRLYEEVQVANDEPPDDEFHGAEPEAADMADADTDGAAVETETEPPSNDSPSPEPVPVMPADDGDIPTETLTEATPTGGKDKPKNRRLSIAARLIAGVAVLFAIGYVLGSAGVDLPLVNSGPEPPTESRQPPPLPPPGSKVNARTGEVETAAIDRAVPDGVRIEGGSILRVCNLPSDYPCFLEGSQPPIPARAGDTIEFRVRLSNPSVKPLPKVNVGILWDRSSDHPKQWLVSAFVGWNAPGELNPIKGTNMVKLLFPTRINKLTYIHGSTELLDGDGKFVGRLPNGIIVRKGNFGLWLNELGPPLSCPTCNPERYKRYISFMAEVE